MRPWSGVWETEVGGEGEARAGGRAGGLSRRCSRSSTKLATQPPHVTPLQPEVLQVVSSSLPVISATWPAIEYGEYSSLATDMLAMQFSLLPIHRCLH